MFHAGLNRRLRGLGLSGRHVDVAVASRALTLTGESGGTVVIAAADIRHLRVGFAQSRGVTYHQLLLWSGANRAPLELGTADSAEHRGFADLVLTLAGALERSGRLDIVEIGEKTLWASFMLSMFSLFALAALALILFVLSEDERALGIPRAFALMVPCGLFLGALGALWWAWTRHWPRRIRSLTELVRVLPHRG